LGKRLKTVFLKGKLDMKNKYSLYTTMATHRWRYRVAVLLGIATVVAAAGCTLYPRVTELPPLDTGEQHVVARFLRSEKNYSSTELTRVLKAEFIGISQGEMTAYFKSIGGTCDTKPPSNPFYPPSLFTLCELGTGICDKTTSPSIFCTYEHTVPMKFYKPSLASVLGLEKPADGISTKAMTITASVENSNDKKVIKNIVSHIIQTGGVKEDRQFKYGD
jgi:hypothetical protein